MHNGLIGNWTRLRRKVESLIPDEFYGSRIGTTDSEAVFLAILGAGGDKDPLGATARTLATLTDMVEPNKEPLRFTAALANGRDLYAFRYSANDNANSLYYRESGTTSWWSPSRSTPSARTGSRCRPAMRSWRKPASGSRSSRSSASSVSQPSDLTRLRLPHSMAAARS